ncbi:MAG: 2Fe-2S iron-sulfur cluster-binding protein [Thermoplasmata archaeon]
MTSAGGAPDQHERSNSTGQRARRGLPLLQRSIRYHRPRAPFCGVGYCTNCLVRTDERLNVRACREGFPTEGVRPTSQAWPSPRYDLFGVLDLLLPRGIDTLHGFRRPPWAVRAYQRVVRRLAGYDDPSSISRPTHFDPPSVRTVDVAIVGHGTSGAAAAAELRARGVDSLLTLDRERESATPGSRPDLEGTSAVFLPPPSAGAAHPFRLLATQGSSGSILVHARRVVVATGGYDASLLFAGNDRPGVMTAEGAMRFAREGFTPFDRAVVVGGGERARSVLERFPGQVEAIVAPGAIDPDLTRAASDRRVPLYPRSLLVSTHGRRAVRSVRIRSRSRGPYATLGADAVVLAHRRIPHPQLFFQAGARMEWRGANGAYYPRTDVHGATSVEGLYAIGEAAGTVEANGAHASGQATGRALAESEPPSLDLDAPGGAPTPTELEGYYRELLEEPEGLSKWIACPCEDVLLREVKEASARGYRGIEVVKRYTGLGTGLCQGRYCLPDALLVLSILEGRPPSDVGYITQRPPVVPTTLGQLASLADALGAEPGR